MARVLVTGVAGQIGSFLAERLISGGHGVIGIEHAPPARALPAAVELRLVPLAADGVEALIDACGALDAIVHLAGKTSVGESWRAPMETFEINARVSAALAFAAQARKIAFVNASSAEIFGHAAEGVQRETTPIAPVSPYGVAKAAAHMATSLTREEMGARATNLVFYLGESARRAPHFVFRKITRGLAAVALGRADHVSLGNTSAIRDFCHADDFARAAEMFALGAAPGDYIVASGEAHAIADIATACCEVLGLDPAKVLRTDPSLFRTADIARLVGDASKIRGLGWAPSMNFRELVRSIVEHDLDATKRGEN
jgi:GDPmannose 4,6-dehydratase